MSSLILNVHDLALDLFMVNIKCKYAIWKPMHDFYFMAILFSFFVTLSVTVSKIFIVEMCKPLTLNVGMDLGQM